MNIVMFTNSYTPTVGGIEKSVQTFTEDFRELGHNTLIVTPDVDHAEASNELVFHVPAIKEINGSQYSLKIPFPSKLKERLDSFKPDIIHSHHPFMLGDTALRVARVRDLPLVFTHHTLYERYANFFGIESELFERITINLPVEYANLCDCVIAPTQSIKQIIRSRGVTTPVEIIPTGINTDYFAHGRADQFRELYAIPDDAFVVGHVGRLITAKNVIYLSRATSLFLQEQPDAWLVIVGSGKQETAMLDEFDRYGVAERVIFTGPLGGPLLADAYAAMDIFVFASQTDTQGLVLIESLASGVPIIALDGPGVRDVVRHGLDGRLMPADTPVSSFTQHLITAHRSPSLLRQWKQHTVEQATRFDRTASAKRMLDVYQGLLGQWHKKNGEYISLWDRFHDRIAAEWTLLGQKTSVLINAILDNT